MKELFIQDELSEVEKIFKDISVGNFYLNSGLTYHASYKNLKETSGVYIVNDFQCKEH
ncbi:MULTISPECIES: hypothetical protein [Flavobacterium]|uniref:hypothetical protein n=1 Tax=Flavobacterium TaxID=237 RepID=UPI0013DE371A|nr:MULTISPECIES: hypothetical protein [Flavobacterium]MDP5200219.1 hypothetical protein [Flavobacterium sp. DG2-3]